MESLKLLCVKPKVCWIIFIVLNAVTIILMIAAVSTSKWVRLDSNKDGYDFDGSLFELERTSALLEKYEGKGYGEVAEDWCDAADEADPKENLLDAGCAMFGLLSACCMFLCIYELLAIAYIAINIVSLSVFLCNLDLIWLSFVAVFLSNMWHGIGYLVYSLSNRINFHDKCDVFANESTPGQLCGEDGPALSLFVFIFMAVHGIFQCIFSGMYYKQKFLLGISLRSFRLNYPQAGEYPIEPIVYPQNKGGNIEMDASVQNLQK